MDPNAVIDSYVDDVVRRLPFRQRRDVGFELRSLLGEERSSKPTSRRCRKGRRRTTSST